MDNKPTLSEELQEIFKDQHFTAYQLRHFERYLTRLPGLQPRIIIPLLKKKIITPEQFSILCTDEFTIFRKKIENIVLRNQLLANHLLSFDEIDIPLQFKYICSENSALFATVRQSIKTSHEPLRWNIEIEKIASDPHNPLRIQALICQYVALGEAEQIAAKEKLLEQLNEFLAKTELDFLERATLPEELSTTIGFELEHFGTPDDFKPILAEISAANGWTNTDDGSVIPDNPELESVESVTGILKTKDDLVRALKFVELLKTCGARVNDSCGFHVHLGVTNQLGKVGTELHRPERFSDLDISNEELQLKILKTFLKYYYLCAEPEFSRVLRRPNHYSQTVYFEGIEGHLETLTHYLLTAQNTEISDQLQYMREELIGLTSLTRRKLRTSPETLPADQDIIMRKVERSNPSYKKLISEGKTHLFYRKVTEEEKSDIHGYQKNSILEGLENATTIAELSKAVNSSIGSAASEDHISRKYHVNLQSLKLASSTDDPEAAEHYHGTVEIRRHEGTVDAEKVARWIVTLDKILDHAISYTAETIRLEHSQEATPPNLHEEAYHEHAKAVTDTAENFVKSRDVKNLTAKQLKQDPKTVTR